MVHGTCVEIGGRAVLLRGPPGSGKSDLALRLIECGARLVADDRVVLHGEEGVLYAFTPPAIAGTIEVRGVGLLRVPFAPTTRLRLAVDLVGSPVSERLPDASRCCYDGIVLPLIALAPFEASAAAKLRLAVARPWPAAVGDQKG